MIVKRIVILANSIKHQKRCVAGREVWYSGGIHKLGGWVRPITTAGKGEIALEQSALPDGSQPAVMQFVDLPLVEHAGDPTQPENWRLAVDKPWRLVTTVPAMDPAMLREEPAHLWVHHWKDKTDRISSASVAAMVEMTGGASPSLHLIRPVNFRLVAHTDRATGKRHRRAVFEYGKHRYNLSVTDPTVDDRYFRPFPPPREGPRKVTLPGGDNCLLCVSRTPVFADGMHYKIVATVIETPGE